MTATAEEKFAEVDPTTVQIGTDGAPNAVLHAAAHIAEMKDCAEIDSYVAACQANAVAEGHPPPGTHLARFKDERAAGKNGGEITR